jgi:hypothetical protein
MKAPDLAITYQNLTIGKTGRNALVYNPASPGAQPPSADTMLSFLRLLHNRLATVSHHLQPDDGGRRQAFAGLRRSLAFAEAYLEKIEWLRQYPEPPCHIAILGPTQAGKSSVLNWLTGASLAAVSPLAGYTVHAQGFAMTGDATAFARIDRYFHAYRRCDRAALNPEHFDSFSLDLAPPNSMDRGNPLTGTIVWDTPDFDSVQSRDYQDAVLRVAALADIVILVVSKDKYGDLTVWEFMKLLEPLRQPTLLLLNKTDAESRVTLLRSLEDKWRAHRSDAPPPVLAIPYLDKTGGLTGQDDLRRQWLGELQTALAAVNRNHYPAHGRRLLAAHWPAWTAPVLAEHRLTGEWQTSVAAAVADCMTRYQRDYQEQPHHYETFQRALAELLTLLEVPGIGNALLTARRLVTWPVRQVAKLGRMARRDDALIAAGEAAVLCQLAEHALIRLGEELLMTTSSDPLESGWWNSLNRRLSGQRTVLLTRFESATRRYISAFQPEIERTARSLYEHLQEHPMVLNSLRATRVTTDAAALAMALHTGGIGLQDFVIAPAMLSVTTLLAESALGRYMSKAAEQLKHRQRAAVEELFRTAMQQPLTELPSELDPDTRLNIPPAALAAATAQIT